MVVNRRYLRANTNSNQLEDDDQIHPVALIVDAWDMVSWDPDCWVVLDPKIGPRGTH